MNLAGRNVVVTGKIPGLTRYDAEAQLGEAGAHVQSAVGKTTDLLIIGEAVGAKKLSRARDLAVEVVPWAEAIA